MAEVKMPPGAVGAYPQGWKKSDAINRLWQQLHVVMYNRDLDDPMVVEINEVFHSIDFSRITVDQIETLEYLFKLVIRCAKR